MYNHNKCIEKIIDKTKRTRLCIVLALMMSLCLGVLFSVSLSCKNNTVYAQTVICDGNHSGFTELPSVGGELFEGKYYLDNDTQLAANITISSDITVTICLNGRVLTGAPNNGKNAASDTSIFSVTAGTLNICDCDSTNGIHHYKIKEVKASVEQDEEATNPEFSNKLNQRYYDFSGEWEGRGDGVVYGGLITGGHKRGEKGNGSIKGGGSAILIGLQDSITTATVNIYGGTLSGNSSASISTYGWKRERSGTICTIDNGTLNFFGGNVIGNSARYSGAGLFNFGGAMNILGGMISDNYSLDSVYSSNNTNAEYSTVGGIYKDNPPNVLSQISISGNAKIIDNKGYAFKTDNVIGNTINTFYNANVGVSTETRDYINIVGKLYLEKDGAKDYAKIGLAVGVTNVAQLTFGYTANGNTAAEVSEIFVSDAKNGMIKYNADLGELQYEVGSKTPGDIVIEDIENTIGDVIKDIPIVGDKDIGGKVNGKLGNVIENADGTYTYKDKIYATYEDVIAAIGVEVKTEVVEEVKTEIKEVITDTYDRVCNGESIKNVLNMVSENIDDISVDNCQNLTDIYNTAYKELNFLRDLQKTIDEMTKVYNDKFYDTSYTQKSIDVLYLNFTQNIELLSVAKDQTAVDNITTSWDNQLMHLEKKTDATKEIVQAKVNIIYILIPLGIIALLIIAYFAVGHLGKKEARRGK